MQTNKSTNIFIALGISVAALFFTGCKKDLGSQSITVSGQPKATQMSYNWNWDDPSQDFLPSSPANVVYKPWASGSTKIDPAIVNDYSSANGWELIYCSFSPTTTITATPAQPLFFSLYNRFRGLYRIYLYQPATTVYSSYINYGLALYGNQNSSMLNFDGQALVDPRVNIPASQKVYNVGTINSATGTWFAFQHEIAYDPTVASPGFSFPNFGINWNAQFVNVTSLTMNGSQIGSLSGTITEPSSFNLGNTLVQGVFEATGTGALAGDNKLQSAFGSAVSSALGNTINGFFNGILGGNGPNVQTVDLKLNTTIQLSGSMTQGGGMVNQQYALPGQSNSQSVIGLAPRPENNQVMGVFNLPQRPKVNASTTSNIDYNIHGTDYSSDFSVDASFLNSIIAYNTSVINATTPGATIQNFRTELVFIPNGVQSANIQYQTLRVGGTLEPGIGYTVSPIMNISYSDYEDNLGFNPTSFEFAVRITFDVVPNNGSPTSTIVKTFLADVVPL